MSAWFLIQIVFNIFFALGIFIIVMRMNRAPKDDPRLSRGLQLLQSKIAVLEDLSDRTEMQVNQLTAILEQKCREVQAKVQIAEQTVHAIRVSTERSLEVAKIFQDKIPHQEIIERQNTIKYVQAARMAHQGKNIDEITQVVDLPRGEIEFIAKVNREQLMFDEESLPWWAREGASSDEALMNQSSNGGTLNASAAMMGAHSGSGLPVNMAANMTSSLMSQASNASVSHLGFVENNSDTTQANPVHPAETADRLRAEMELAEQQRLVENLSRLQFEMQNLDMQLARENVGRDFESAFEPPKVEQASLKKIGEEFRRAIDEANQQPVKASVLPPLEQLSSLIPQVMSGFAAGMEAISSPKASPAPSAVEAAPMVNTAAVAATPQESANSRDPILARAMAQAKVQAVLKATAQPKSGTQISPELMAAREVAKQSTPSTMNQVINSRSQPGTPPPVIRKVQFPKLESPE